MNCEAGGELDLRGYRHSKHGLILFDGIEAQAVAEHRRLFQASMAMVQHGSSVPNMHQHMVYMHRVRIVCASNDWTASLQRLSADYRSWVVANCFHVRCEQPLWQRSSSEL